MMYSIPRLSFPSSPQIWRKKGAKVDYAVKLGGKIAILVECKSCGSDLSQQHMSQLYRYFSVTDARFAILSNGQQLENAQIPPNEAAEIIGHEKGFTYGTYSVGLGLRRLKEIIEVVRYVAP